MRRALRLSWLFVSTALSAQMEYRGNFLAGLLESLGQVGIGLLSLLLFFRNAPSLGGWTWPQAALVFGLYLLTLSFISVMLYPNLNRIAEQVRLGTMDFTLLKPLDAQFQVSVRNVNAFRLGDTLIGLGVTLWALANVQFHPAGLLLAALLYLCALCIVYSIFLILATTAFWWVKVENITELFTGLLGAARFPVTAFPAGVRLFLTFVVPVAFITTVPAQAVLGQVSWQVAWLSPVVAGLLLVLSRRFWLFALGSYTSASS